MWVMAMILNKQQDMNDELSKRIAADLCVKETTAATDGETPDFVEGSEYAKDFQKTGKFSLVWVLVIFLVVVVGIVVAFNL